LSVVLNNLVDPVRVVPEVYNFRAGMDLGYILHALARSQHPAMHDAAELMVNYASNSGLFAEYYEHEDGVITPFSGTLRPWESGINAAAMAQYLLAFQPDLPNNLIAFEPHLPPEWQGWETRKIDLYKQGSIQVAIKRVNSQAVSISLTRYDGNTPLDVRLKFGGFGSSIHLKNEYYIDLSDDNGIVETEFTLNEKDEISFLLQSGNNNN
jgi:hypothetical protein